MFINMLNLGTIDATHNISLDRIYGRDTSFIPLDRIVELAWESAHNEARARGRALGRIVEHHDHPTHIPVNSPMKLDRTIYSIWSKLDTSPISLPTPCREVHEQEIELKRAHTVHSTY